MVPILLPSWGPRLRLGREGHRREIVVICDSFRFGGDKGAYHARPRFSHPAGVDPISPPSKRHGTRRYRTRTTYAIGQLDAPRRCRIIAPAVHDTRPNLVAVSSWWRRRVLPPRPTAFKSNRITVILVRGAFTTTGRYSPRSPPTTSGNLCPRYRANSSLPPSRRRNFKTYIPSISH